MKIQIELPKNLIEQLEQKKEDFGFDNTSEYIEYIIIDYLTQEEHNPDNNEMKDRLKRLGYL